MTTRPARNLRTESLSAVLRHRTRAAHASAEAAFDIGGALADRSSYAALLGRLRGYYGPAEAAVLQVAGWAGLDPPIDVLARARVDLLDADLRRLGLADPALFSQMSSPAVDSLAAGLGWLYVLEGSALGGQVIAARARVALGEGIPVDFFTSAGRAPGRNWRDLQHALDAFGAVAGAAASEQVVAAAADSFERFGPWIRGRRSP